VGAAWGCFDRAFDWYEDQRVFTQIHNIRDDGGVCSQLKSRLWQDWSDNNIRYDHSGSTVAGQFGDAHNTPGIVHLTMEAFAAGNGDIELQYTLIHEAAHRIGISSDPEAYAYEQLCYGMGW
jgi:hypothetical protein